MDVIFLDVQFINRPVIDLSAFTEQVVEAAGQWAYQEPSSELRYPDQMVFEAVGRVSTMFIAGHDVSMP